MEDKRQTQFAKNRNEMKDISTDLTELLKEYKRIL